MSSNSLEVKMKHGTCEYGIEATLSLKAPKSRMYPKIVET
jgi:hypothetical protein